MENNCVTSDFTFGYINKRFRRTDASISAELTCLFTIYHLAEISALRVQRLLSHHRFVRFDAWPRSLLTDRQELGYLEPS